METPLFAYPSPARTIHRLTTQPIHTDARRVISQKKIIFRSTLLFLGSYGADPLVWSSRAHTFDGGEDRARHLDEHALGDRVN